jgi:hypothetical protein
MELLGYKNTSTKIEYDENGFINFNEMIFFGDDFLTTGLSSFKCVLVEKTSDLYSYNITIQEESILGHYVADGKVNIYLENGNIKEIFVNGVKYGKLHDKYNDCFSIYPEQYIHLIYTNSRRLPV